MKILSTSEIDELRQNISGQVVLPHDDNYDGARKIWNAMIDSTPPLSSVLLTSRGEGQRPPARSTWWRAQHKPEYKTQLTRGSLSLGTPSRCSDTHQQTR